MAFAFNEEQRALRDSVRSFANDQSPIASFRALREQKDGVGFDNTVWQSMIELGLSGALFPEAYGGFEFGCTGLAGCMEELGRTLVASPLLASILSGATILHAGSEEQKQTLLPQLISGEKFIALACDEGHHHNPTHVNTTATREGNTFILNGNKTRIISGIAANLFVVSAHVSNSQNISLFLVDVAATGLRREAVTLVDSQRYAKLALDNVCIPESHLLGEIDKGLPALERALDYGRICLTAEMFGGMQEIFERTVQYLKERKQFGVLIGTFQALQHRAAHMYTEIEMCKSILMLALDALEKNADNAAQLVSAAKAKTSDTYELISNEATQMHGGIGVTDELDVGLFLKRARVSAELLGSARFHYDRYATLEGF
ncbi:MAG: acyl-CoA dehydrogenase [Pseudomonadales bacterium]